MTKTISIISILLFFFNVAISQELVEWRGPGRTGVYNETDLQKKWNKTGPELVWTSDSIPVGYSSVVVSNNTAYTTGRKDSVDVIVALDSVGNIKWQTAYGMAWDNSYNESRCTPTIQEGNVYVSSGLGDIACVDAKSGKLLWQVKASEIFEGTYGKWGISESLLLVDDKVIYTPGGNKTTIVALSKKDGEIIWQSESLEDNPSYTSPLLIDRNGIRQIVTTTENFIIGVDTDDGEILWKFDYGKYAGGKWKSNNHTNTPLYYNGGIFVSSGYDHHCVMLDLSNDASSVSLRWVDSTLDIHHGGAVRIGNYIYGANWESNRMGKWICMKWDDGEIMYEEEWENKGSIISADDMLYCYEEKNGNIALVEVNPIQFDVFSSFQVPFGRGPYWAHPVIVDGIMYIRNQEFVMAYDIKE